MEHPESSVTPIHTPTIPDLQYRVCTQRYLSFEAALQPRVKTLLVNGSPKSIVHTAGLCTTFRHYCCECCFDLVKASFTSASATAYFLLLAPASSPLLLLLLASSESREDHHPPPFKGAFKLPFTGRNKGDPSEALKGNPSNLHLCATFPSLVIDTIRFDPSFLQKLVTPSSRLPS